MNFCGSLKHTFRGVGANSGKRTAEPGSQTSALPHCDSTNAFVISWIHFAAHHRPCYSLLLHPVLYVAVWLLNPPEFVTLNLNFRGVVLKVWPVLPGKSLNCRRTDSIPHVLSQELWERAKQIVWTGLPGHSDAHWSWRPTAFEVRALVLFHREHIPFPNMWLALVFLHTVATTLMSEFKSFRKLTSILRSIGLFLLIYYHYSYLLVSNHCIAKIILKGP